MARWLNKVNLQDSGFRQKSTMSIGKLAWMVEQSTELMLLKQLLRAPASVKAR